MLSAAKRSPPPVACEPEDGVGVGDALEVVALTLELEEVALGVPIAPAVADTGLVVPTVVVEVELTSEPVPQGIADPSG